MRESVCVHHIRYSMNGIDSCVGQVAHGPFCSVACAALLPGTAVLLEDCGMSGGSLRARQAAPS